MTNQVDLFFLLKNAVAIVEFGVDTMANLMGFRKSISGNSSILEDFIDKMEQLTIIYTFIGFTKTTRTYL